MKRISPEKINITVQPVFWLVMVFALVVIPVKWTAAWFAAVLFHELGHYAALKICAVPVYSVTVRLSGAYMHTAPMVNAQEIFVAAMGPVASAILVVMSKWLPCTAICALFQLTFNLLPLSGFDGERVLRGCLRMLLPQEYIVPVIGCVQVILSVLLCAFLLYLRWGIVLAGIAVSILLRRVCVTFPCKGGKQIVQ